MFWFDYDRYQRDIGEKGKKLPHNPDEGISHNMVTWLYTRHLEHPWFKPDLLTSDTTLRQAAKEPPTTSSGLFPVVPGHAPK